MIRIVFLVCLIVPSAYCFVVSYIPRNFNSQNDPNDKILQSKDMQDCFNSFDNVTDCVVNEVVKFIRDTDYSAWARSNIDVPGFTVILRNRNGSRDEKVKKNCWPKEDTEGQFSFRFFWESKWSTALCMYSYSCGGKRITGTYDLYSRFVSFGQEMNEAIPEKPSEPINTNDFNGREIKIKTDPIFVKPAQFSKFDRSKIDQSSPELNLTSPTFVVEPRLNHVEYAGKFILNIFDEVSNGTEKK